MRVVVAVLFAFLVYLQFTLWFGKGGIRDEQILEGTAAELQAEILVLKDRNQTLAAEVLDLKQGMDAIEELARTEMGMVKEGELFFQIVKPPSGDEQPRESTNRE
ncbi:MAG: cell division protein FtsB [Proteobacteria bacterium]|nr:cell division protein FtsB [Pseudomonadota bacterium]